MFTNPFLLNCSQKRSQIDLAMILQKKKEECETVKGGGGRNKDAEEEIIAGKAYTSFFLYLSIYLFIYVVS